MQVRPIWSLDSDLDPPFVILCAFCRSTKSAQETSVQLTQLVIVTVEIHRRCWGNGRGAENTTAFHFWGVLWVGERTLRPSRPEAKIAHVDPMSDLSCLGW